jgi:hypothetical protein
MSSEMLTTYLNDHLAGSVAALELVEYLLRHEKANRESYATLRTEIEEDQQTLRQLLAELGGKESQVRKAAAWLTEKLGQAKLRLDDQGAGELRALEALETLGLGIQGKLSLWRALGSVAGTIPQLERLDLPRLQRRAVEQFERVDKLRIQAARAALTL